MLEQKCCPLHIFQVRIHKNLAPFIYHWSFIVLYCIQRNIVDWFIVHTYSTRSHWGFLILIQSTNCINFYILKGMRTALFSSLQAYLIWFQRGLLQQPETKKQNLKSKSQSAKIWEKCNRVYSLLTVHTTALNDCNWPCRACYIA